MTSPLEPDRRPIASRNTVWASAVANRLAQGGWSPNQISVAGMVAAITAGLCLALTSHFEAPIRSIGFLLAAFLAFVRLLANLFDGMVAISTGTRSSVGELYNEVPDRISDSAILIGAGYAAGGHIELGFVSACLALFIAYLRAQGKAAGAQSEFCGPMAKPQRMATIIAASIASAFLPQESLIASTQVGILGWALMLIVLGGLFTVFRRLKRIAATLKGKT